MRDAARAARENWIKKTERSTKMLVLSRRVGESIMIDNRIKVTINEIRDGTVIRLGIEADRSIVVDRFEVYQDKQRDKLEGRPWPRMGGEFDE
jgi:carbon storage regulator CsrA